jgi:hypothetical protein
MKTFEGNGTKFFIGMPILERLTMRIEDTDNFITLTLSDNKGTMLQIALTDEMKKELMRVCKNAKKENRK